MGGTQQSFNQARKTSTKPLLQYTQTSGTTSSSQLPGQPQQVLRVSQN